MAKKRSSISEKLKAEIISLSNNRCCVCQTPFIHLHHLDMDPSNNEQDNIAPLCPNCHAQAHAKNEMTSNLTPSIIKTLRDKWYDYCHSRKEGSKISASAKLKVKNFIHSLGLADYSWKKSFKDIDPLYENMSREEIIDRVFSTSNRDDLITILETIKGMYVSYLSDDSILNKFKTVCYSFGIDYEELL